MSEKYNKSTAYRLACAGVALVALTAFGKAEAAPEPQTAPAVSANPAEAAATHRVARPETMGRLRDTPIEIRGDQTCQATTRAALELLRNQAPAEYQLVDGYIEIIECAPDKSGMYAWEQEPRFVAGDTTSQAGTVWYAGSIAHDAEHSKLFHDYQAAHPGAEVPQTAWGGKQPEEACLAVQADTLRQIGGTAAQIDYVNRVIDTEYYNVPLEDRWW